MFKYLIFSLIALALIVGIASADTTTLSTYYPAPYGRYREFSTTGKTTLATDEFGNEGPNALVGIGTTDPQAILDVSSDSSAFLPPRIEDDTQRDTNITPLEGMVIYNKAKKIMELYDGTDWQPVGGTGAMPVGTIVPFAASGALPMGYLECNGAEVSRSVYSGLFSVIGISYGLGNGSTTFNLPDLRGRFPLGQDSMGGVSADRVTAAQADIIGQGSGAESHTLTVSQMPSHRHHSGTYVEKSAWGPTMAYGGIDATEGSRTASGNALGRMPYTNYTGDDEAHNNMSPYLTVRYIIKAN